VLLLLSCVSGFTFDALFLLSIFLPFSFYILACGIFLCLLHGTKLFTWCKKYSIGISFLLIEINPFFLCFIDDCFWLFMSCLFARFKNVFKKINFFFYFFLYLKLIFFVFLDHFNMLMSKIIFKK
jgi:hypothetical protein